MALDFYDGLGSGIMFGALIMAAWENARLVTSSAEKEVGH